MAAQLDEVTIQILVNDEVKQTIRWSHSPAALGKNTLTGKVRLQLNAEDEVRVRVVPTEVDGVKPSYTVYPESSISIVKARHFG